MEQRWLEIVSGADRSLTGGLARCALAGLERPYGAVVRWRNRRFDRGARRSLGLGRATVSIGNLTVGGTGKTPMVIEVARRLIARGHRPGVLLRGYRSAGGVSDEAVLLGEALGDAAEVEVNADRVAGAAAVLGRREDVSCFILDDGFQHRRAARDLDLVLIDATRPFGNGRLLPRGLLREPMQSLARADGVILTRVDQVSEAELAETAQRVAAITGQAVLGQTALAWTGLCGNGETLPIDWLSGRRVAAVAGIGNPKAFRQQLERHGARIVGWHTPGDHHVYRAGDVERICRAVSEAAGEAVVMTEKDWVKWRAAASSAAAAEGVKQYRVTTAVRFIEGEEEIDAALGRADDDSISR